MKTPIRTTVGAVGPDRFVRHVEVKPLQWRGYWEAMAPQAKEQQARKVRR